MTDCLEICLPVQSPDTPREPVISALVTCLSEMFPRECDHKISLGLHNICQGHRADLLFAAPCQEIILST